VNDARARPDNASAPGLPSAAVLQADKTTQSASSLSCATSLVVSNPLSKSDAGPDREPPST
jgi:hypothetical protein